MCESKQPWKGSPLCLSLKKPSPPLGIKLEGVAIVLTDCEGVEAYFSNSCVLNWSF